MTVEPDGHAGEEAPKRVPLTTVGGQWLRLGCTGFGGPPTHIALLRRLCVERRRWMSAQEFEDGVATTNLLPGPASTQMAIFCAWRLRGVAGALLGGACFIVPGLVMILALAAVFLAHDPSPGVLGAAAGAGAAVPAVALGAASQLAPTSWSRAEGFPGARWRWVVYVLAGGATAATIGPYLVLVLLACGALEILMRNSGRRSGRSGWAVAPMVIHTAALGGLGALCWVAFKVGALSYGGGFVIVPLMQHDAVGTYHWLTAAQFLNAVALGQVTPGPVVLTVAVIGYAAAGVGGGLLATAVAFAPSFLFVLLGAPRFGSIRGSAVVGSFFAGASPAVVGAIAGSAIPLGLAFQHLWQVPVLGGALGWLFLARRGVVSALLVAALAGTLIVLAGG